MKILEFLLPALVIAYGLAVAPAQAQVDTVSTGSGWLLRDFLPQEHPAPPALAPDTPPPPPVPPREECKAPFREAHPRVYFVAKWGRRGYKWVVKPTLEIGSYLAQIKYGMRW